MFIPWQELWNAFDPAPNLKQLWDRWSLGGRIAPQALRAFRPKIRLFIERDNYILKAVESSWELEAALRLRYRVFHQELLGKRGAVRLDADAFDLHCDHLIIMDKQNNQTIGTYRLISSSFSSTFYSAQEFNLDALLRLPGVKLELGRACIHPDYRNGLILALLWKGIHRYFEAVNARYIFGCSSIQTTDPAAVSRFCRYFQAQRFAFEDMAFPVQPGYRFAPVLNWEDDTADLEIKRRIPPLLMSYLHAGARVGREPALDRAFRCVDFLTILETVKLETAYNRKFGKC